MDESEQKRYLAFLGERRAQILERMAGACERAGRDTGEVTLLAVSKTVDVGSVALAWQAGYRAFGENRPQELRRKLEGLSSHPEMDGVRFDMIGNLQTNKINMVVGNVTLIHSISSMHLADAVSSRSQTHGVTSRVLLEVNVSGEESKSGLTPDEARQGLEHVLCLPGLDLQGLMTMAPRNEPDVARRTFSGLRELRDELATRSGRELPILSCGMSDDFQIAIEEGSTLVRLGRTVFDPGYELK
ncbi:YggS family pyridoxal phosphate-dependent enzyme [Olsenella porci]|uniref:YggS family pyridoxal phosphate-dependent enzyme n=1 Tax=Olsenella porci TaxID=2652279 RepID=UPI0018A6BA58|nr:YggS family pyridoxal phosphate-dependent enzyme [Olsenella porci]